MDLGEWVSDNHTSGPLRSAAARALAGSFDAYAAAVETIWVFVVISVLAFGFQLRVASATIGPITVAGSLGPVFAGTVAWLGLTVRTYVEMDDGLRAKI